MRAGKSTICYAVCSIYVHPNLRLSLLPCVLNIVSAIPQALHIRLCHLPMRGVYAADLQENPTVRFVSMLVAKYILLKH